MYEDCERINFNNLKDISNDIGIQKPFYIRNRNRKVFRDEDMISFIMVKMYGKRSLVQMAINEIKPYFGLTKMRMNIVKDTFLDENGSKIWFYDNYKKFSVPLFKKISNEKLCRSLAKIVCFDYIIGNNERFSSNLVFSNDYREIYTIDEDDAFLYGGMDKKFYHPVFSSLKRHTSWFIEDTIKNIDENFLNELAVNVEKYGLDKRYVEFCKNRFENLKDKKLLLLL